ncbi:3593_t:CDS:10, partial [Gigaspora margarita]
MPDHGDEIEDFQYHTWNVINWRNLEKKITGPEFEAGGWKWRILLFPFGNNKSNEVSIYLDFVDPEMAPIDTRHRFTAEESDWGFEEFYEQDKLFIPSDGRTRPLIENNSCNITALVRIIKDPNENDDKSISSTLQEIFYELQTSNIPVDTIEFTKFFGWDSFDYFGKMEIREFSSILRENLENKMKNTKVDGTISKLFTGTMKSYIKCVDVDYESIRIEDYYDIQLSVKGCKNLDDSFLDYIQEKTLDGDNKYKAEDYGLQVAKKGIMFESFPPVLYLHLDRFEYDNQNNRMIKINDRYEFPLEIDLQKYLSPDADRSKSYKYSLHGVFIHDDCDCYEDPNRYFVFLRPEKNRRWIRFIDERVTLVTEKKVLDDYYDGGNAANAYMLLYIRDHDIDELLFNILPNDIPVHLQRRSEEEKVIYNRKKEDSNLYLQTWVVTEENFKNHKGFDLVNFDNPQYSFMEISQFKILKEDTYGTFKKMVAEKFKFPADQLRFWVLVSRLNKTIRLDLPIPDSFVDK